MTQLGVSCISCAWAGRKLHEGAVCAKLLQSQRNLLEPRAGVEVKHHQEDVSVHLSYTVRVTLGPRSQLFRVRPRLLHIRSLHPAARYVAGTPVQVEVSQLQ